MECAILTKLQEWILAGVQAFIDFLIAAINEQLQRLKSLRAIRKLVQICSLQILITLRFPILFLLPFLVSTTYGDSRARTGKTKQAWHPCYL
jgi:hypothetical protein